MDRRVRAAYRKYPTAGEEVALAFTADRFLTRTRLGDFSADWSFLRRVVELRDGFVLVLKNDGGVTWLPDHALAAPFDHRAAAELFREKVRPFWVVDRAAGTTPV